MRTKLPEKTYKITTVAVPVPTFNQLRHIANFYGMSQSAFIRLAILLAIQVFQNEEIDFSALPTIKITKRTDRKKSFLDDEL